MRGRQDGNARAAAPELFVGYVGYNSPVLLLRSPSSVSYKYSIGTRGVWPCQIQSKNIIEEHDGQR